MTIDWFTYLAQIVNFLVLVWLLKRFLYAPITNAMQQREDRITARIVEASQKQAEAQQAADDFRHRREQLEQERHGMFESTKTEVEATRQQLLTQARSDVDKRRVDWFAALNREQATLSQVVRQRCGEQVTAATTHALRHLADSDLEEQMLRTFIQKLDDQDIGDRTVRQRLQQDTEAAKNEDASVSVCTAFDVLPIWHERLKSALTHHFGLVNIEFRVLPEIICGIEIQIGSEKIGWSVEEYLETLNEEFRRLVEQPVS